MGQREIGGMLFYTTWIDIIWLGGRLKNCGCML